MKFKVAVSINTGERPYRVHVAVPAGGGRFFLYEYHLKRLYDAIIYMSDYLHEFEKSPEGIIAFHEGRVKEYETNLALPFSGI